jgi:hypothetical protein
MSLRLVVLDTDDVDHCGECGRTIVPEPGDPETITADAFVAAWIDREGNVRAVASDDPIPARLLDVFEPQVARTVTKATHERTRREARKLAVMNGS